MFRHINAIFWELHVPRKILQFCLRLGWMWIMVHSVWPAGHTEWTIIQFDNLTSTIKHAYKALRAFVGYLATDYKKCSVQLSRLCGWFNERRNVRIQNNCGTVYSRISLLCNTGNVQQIKGYELHWQWDQCFVNKLEEHFVVFYARKGGYKLVTLPRTVTLLVTDTIRSYDLNFHPVPHGVPVSYERYTMAFRVCDGSQKSDECTEGERSGRRWRVTLHVQTCSGHNRIIPLMRRPNPDSAPNMPVTLPRNQLFIRYVVTSRVHTHDTVLRYAATLQVCTHLNRLPTRAVCYAVICWCAVNLTKVSRSVLRLCQ
jgi:hypothetical protein